MKIMKKSEIFNLIKYYYKFNKYKYDNNINKNNSNYKNVKSNDNIIIVIRLKLIIKLINYYYCKYSKIIFTWQ